jgi:hypothetical protein
MVEQHNRTRIFHELDCDWFARRAANQENYRRIDGTADDGRHCMKCDGASDRTASERPLPSLETERGIGVGVHLAILAGAVVAVTAAEAARAKRTAVRRSRRARSEAASAAADATHDGVPPALDPVDPAMSVPTAPPPSRFAARGSCLAARAAGLPVR